MELQDVLDAVHEMRLLVFLECEECEEDDYARHFHQVKLTSRQFKKVSDAIIVKSTKDDSLREGYEMAELRLGGTFKADTFEGLSSTID